MKRNAGASNNVKVLLVHKIGLNFEKRKELHVSVGIRDGVTCNAAVINGKLAARMFANCVSNVTLFNVKGRTFNFFVF